MMVKPPVTDLLKKVDSRYKLVIAVSKRARQLADGATPLTDEKEESKVTTAAIEINEGKVTLADEDTDIEENSIENEEA